MITRAQVTITAHFFDGQHLLSRLRLTKHVPMDVHLCLSVEETQQQHYAISFPNLHYTPNKTIELATTYGDRLAVLERRNGLVNDAICFARF